MTTKTVTTKKKTPPAKLTSEERRKIVSGVTISAPFMNAAIIEPFAKSVLDGVPLFDIVEGLKENIIEVRSGDMASMEAMLIGQAQALQAMFVSLGRKALNQSGLQQYTAIMNLALKAQSQSRATIQALTELKYPRQATFVKQANIAGGNQQVNNATSTQAPAHAREIENQPNELLEAQHNEWLDNGTAATTSGTNQAMETVATQHRCANA
jgi:hypothetical protein